MTLSILLPVRNEPESLLIIVPVLSAVLDISHEIIVIIDDPNDRSKEAARKLQRKYKTVKLVLNPHGRGIPFAIRRGVELARGRYILIYAADDVGPASAIKQMITLMDHGCDFVSGTRYARGGRRIGGPLLGEMLSRTANKLLGTVGNLAFTDATTGFKMFRRSNFQKLELSSPAVGWVLVFEMAIKAQLADFRLGEVPIVAVDRLFGGKSTFQLGPWVKAYLRYFILGAWELWLHGRKPRIKTLDNG